MTQLTIDLREGFHQTPVLIRLDGREVFREQEVTTRTQLGLAKQLQLEVEAPSAKVGIELPATGAVLEHPIDGPGPWFLGVDLDPDGGLRIRTQSEPFGYV